MTDSAHAISTATTTTIRDTLAYARRRLNSLASSALEADLLLAYSLGKPRSYLHTWPEQQLAVTQLDCFHELIARRLGGEPLAYITGHREFWSLDLLVTPATLIPRPETELLVELALQRIPVDVQWKIADLGTGSGAIALALARERPQCTIIATDISPGALVVAQTNAERLSITNVEFRLADTDSDWFAALRAEKMRMIVSNPPYIRSDDPHLAALHFEPQSALEAGHDGLRDLRAIIENAQDKLTGGGLLMLEHGYDQGPEVLRLFDKSAYLNARNFCDSAGHGRVVIGMCRQSKVA